MKATEQKYEPLQLESEYASKLQFIRSIDWRIVSLVLFAFVGGFATLATVLSPLNESNLEVLPDNSPASKRGAGLLLT